MDEDDEESDYSRSSRSDDECGELNYNARAAQTGLAEIVKYKEVSHTETTWDTAIMMFHKEHPSQGWHSHGVQPYAVFMRKAL